MASIVDEFGPFLRVEEAAKLLRISRTSAYALTRLWLDTDGAEGLPAVRIGRSVRVPTAALERLAAGGQLDRDNAVVVALRDAG